MIRNFDVSPAPLSVAGPVLNAALLESLSFAAEEGVDGRKVRSVEIAWQGDGLLGVRMHMNEWGPGEPAIVDAVFGEDGERLR